MEWLQTYNIGHRLIESGKYSWENAYYSSYYPPYIKDTKDRKTPYILELIIDLSLNQVRLDARQLDGIDLDYHHPENPIVKEGYFTSVAGRFTSFYLCTPYGSAKSIFDFFGIKAGKIEAPKKKNELIGFEKEFTNLAQMGLLDEDFKESRLVKIRELVRANKLIVKSLMEVIDNIKLFTEASQEKAFNKKFPEKSDCKKPLKTRLNNAPRGNADIAFIVVKVIEKKGDKGVYLNREKEAKEFYLNHFIGLAKIDAKNPISGCCYFTNSTNVHEVSFPRDNVNLSKLNTNGATTDSNFEGNTFTISRDAYDRIKLGTWFIAKKMTTRIANTTHYILPDFTSDFKITDYKSELTDKVDLVFSESSYEKMKKGLFRLSNQKINSISFIGFAGDDRQIDFINRIQIVEPDYFNHIFQTFIETQDKIADIADGDWNELANFSLASTYRLFPISTSNPKKNPVLEFYKMLFEKTPVPLSFLMDNYEKLIKIIRHGKEDTKGKIGEKSSYGGVLNIPFQSKDYFDNAIGIATLKYLILINFINQIQYTISSMKDKNDNLNKSEEFFKSSGISNSESKKALFYLGRLIKRVGIAQKKQGNAKAILNKINYSGMTIQDIQWLGVEVFEKLKQYNRGNIKALDYGESDWDLFIEYFSKANIQGAGSWKLSEMENVFYLFTGYGMYWQTIDKIDMAENKETEDQNTEEENIETTIDN